MPDITALIPARAGSKRVLRKNLQPVAGKPLFLHAAELARTVTADVIVSTDSPDIAGLARAHGFTVWKRPPELATDDASIDDLVAALGWLEWALLVIQPTVPEITPDDLHYFVERASSTQAGSVMCVEHPHIMWDGVECLTQRRQRQDDVFSWLYQEIGVRYYPPGVAEVKVPHLRLSPVTDIDTPEDLHAVRLRMERKVIVFRVKANQKVGWGHLYRCWQLAEHLQHHDIRFNFVDTDRNAVEETSQRGYDTRWQPSRLSYLDADVIVNDTLDTDEGEMLQLRRWAPVLSLEDQGSGSQYANRVINALYADGGDWMILRPEFRYAPPYEIRDPGGRVLVTFGGTDPTRLTEKVASTLPESKVIKPPGRVVKGGPVVENPSMAAEMLAADVIVCSAGRTLYEAAFLGVPAVVLAQNARETSHTHLGPACGNLYLGLGSLVDGDKIRRSVQQLLGSVTLRHELSVAARRGVDGRGVERVVFEVERLAKGL